MFGVKGFDIVIGNPPYVRVQNLSHNLIDLYKRIFKTAWKRIDISTLFIELGYKVINELGFVCMISSNQFITAEYGRLLREFLIKNKAIRKMVDFGSLPLFENALTYVSIFFVSKIKNETFSYKRIQKLPFMVPTDFWEIGFEALTNEVWSFGNSYETDIIEKMWFNSERLDKFAKCWAGIFTGKDDLLLYNIDHAIENIESDLLIPIIRAQDCDRYTSVNPSKKAFYPYKEVSNKTILYTLHEIEQKFPKAFRFISDNSDTLKSRKDSRKIFGDREGWYGLIRFGRLSRFRKPKIVSPGEVKCNKFAIDLSGAAFSCARVFSITSEDENLDIFYLLAILNSKLAEYYLHKKSSLKQGGYHSYSSSVIDGFPLKIHKCSQLLSTMVQEILNRKLENMETSGLEKQLDIYVYKIYELSFTEARVIDLGLSEAEFNNISIN